MTPSAPARYETVPATVGVVIFFAFVFYGLLLDLPAVAPMVNDFSRHSDSLALRMAAWCVFGSCAALLPQWALRFPVPSRRGGWNLLILGSSALAIAFLSEFLVVLVASVTTHDRDLAELVHLGTSDTLTLKVISGVVIVAATNANRHYQDAARRHQHAAELRTELTKARVDLLRHQLQPHFLFNTLNSVATLAGRDPHAARRMVHRLKLLLEKSLQSATLDEIPLVDELALTLNYVEIERVRYGSRLCFDARMDDDMKHQPVPAFFLQPIVENAIRHGIGRRAAGGSVNIRAYADGEECRIEIEDDGRGIGHRGWVAEGIGLRNTRQRLRLLYGDRQALIIRPGSRGGTLVQVVFPRREKEWIDCA